MDGFVVFNCTVMQCSFNFFIKGYLKIISGIDTFIFIFIDLENCATLSNVWLIPLYVNLCVRYLPVKDVHCRVEHAFNFNQFNICGRTTHHKKSHIFIQCLFQVWIVYWHQLQGTIREKQYFTLICTEGFLQYKLGFWNGSDWTRTGFGTWISIYLYIYILCK